MSIKEFLMKKMLANKLKDVPKAEQDKLFMMIEKHPDLFQKIALEVEEEIKRGKSQMEASIVVMKKYESELKGIL